MLFLSWRRLLIFRQRKKFGQILGLSWINHRFIATFMSKNYCYAIWCGGIHVISSSFCTNSNIIISGKVPTSLEPLCSYARPCNESTSIADESHSAGWILLIFHQFSPRSFCSSDVSNLWHSHIISIPRRIQLRSLLRLLVEISLEDVGIWSLLDTKCSLTFCCLLVLRA